MEYPGYDDSLQNFIVNYSLICVSCKIMSVSTCLVCYQLLAVVKKTLKMKFVLVMCFVCLWWGGSPLCYEEHALEKLF